MRAFAVDVLLFLTVLELSVRAIGALGPYPYRLRALNDVVTLADDPHLSTNPFLFQLVSCNDDYFVDRIAAMPVDGKFPFEALHEPHPTRGWALRPGVSIVHDGVRYSTDAIGERTIGREGGDFPVLVVGDSFSFGVAADDGDAWPTLLAERDRRLAVRNAAVAGYGLDQMLLTLEEKVDTARPRLVIAAFIADDLYRATLGWRDFKKPRFSLRGGRLVLGNVPIGSREEVQAEARRLVAERWPPTGSKAVDLFRGMLTLARTTLRCREYPALNSGILDEMRAVTARAGAGFLLVYLASLREVTEPDFEGPEQQFFADYVRATGVDAVDGRAAFREPGEQFALRGHYGRAEADRVAQLIYDRMRELPTWQRFAPD
jgi:hypothetical protein